MTEVVIIKNWTKPDLFRQTPNSCGVWNGTYFTLETNRECDYVVVLNYSPQVVKFTMPPENVWCLMQEPPNEYFRYRHRTHPIFAKVYTQDETLKGERYIHNQGALPWHIDKTYDELINSPIPPKNRVLSCISSRKNSFQGQRERLRFIQKLQKQVSFDLFGYGFNPVTNKWDALAPYKYSLVIENYSGLDYWSEKLADCLLSWTTPIYYGCTNIDDYFPKDAIIKIDIHDPDVISQIQKIVKSDIWVKNRRSVIKARELILKKYQLFPFLANEIKKHEKENKGKNFVRTAVTVPNQNALFTKLTLSIRSRISQFI